MHELRSMTMCRVSAHICSDCRPLERPIEDFSKKLLLVAFAYHRELFDICSMICDLFTFFVTISSFPRCILSAFVDVKLFSSCVKQRQSHSRTFRRNIRPKFRFISKMIVSCARGVLGCSWWFRNALII